MCAPTATLFSPDDPDPRAHRADLARRADTWMNCITACRPCNGRKGGRLPEEAHMSLLYLPYTPSLHGDMILRVAASWQTRWNSCWQACRAPAACR